MRSMGKFPAKNGRRNTGDGANEAHGPPRRDRRQATPAGATPINPNPKSPANSEAAKLYEEDKTAYEKKVRACVEVDPPERDWFSCKTGSLSSDKKSCCSTGTVTLASVTAQFFYENLGTYVYPLSCSLE